VGERSAQVGPDSGLRAIENLSYLDQTQVLVEMQNDDYSLHFGEVNYRGEGLVDLGDLSHLRRR
jgi:hypothetical protein